MQKKICKYFKLYLVCICLNEPFHFQNPKLSRTICSLCNKFHIAPKKFPLHVIHRLLMIKKNSSVLKHVAIYCCKQMTNPICSHRNFLSNSIWISNSLLFNPIYTKAGLLLNCVSQRQTFYCFATFNFLRPWVGRFLSLPLAFCDWQHSLLLLTYPGLSEIAKRKKKTTHTFISFSMAAVTAQPNLVRTSHSGSVEYLGGISGAYEDDEVELKERKPMQYTVTTTTSYISSANVQTVEYQYPVSRTPPGLEKLDNIRTLVLHQNIQSQESKWLSIIMLLIVHLISGRAIKSFKSFVCHERIFFLMVLKCSTFNEV